jgi:hypothetical protein
MIHGVVVGAAFRWYVFIGFFCRVGFAGLRDALDTTLETLKAIHAYDPSPHWNPTNRLIDSSVCKVVVRRIVLCVESTFHFTLCAISCSAVALQMVLAEVDRDYAVHWLLAKLAQVYDFMTQDETLLYSIDEQGRISQQTP